VTITGVGFPFDASGGSLGDGLSHGAACRFGERGAFNKATWTPATVLSSTSLTCRTPAWEVVSDYASLVAEVQISFSGFPIDGAIDLGGIYDSSTWDTGLVYFMYYDAPAVRTVSIEGTTMSSIMFTGETADENVAVVAVRGGPFLAGAGLTCRFAASSETAATFVSATKITCPVCDADSNGSCGDYHAPLSWLATLPTPTTVSVELSMNGADFHTVGERLHIHGVPHGISLTHARASVGNAAYEANADSGASTMTLDAITVDLVDVHGVAIEDDYGVGGTRGFTITTTLDVALSPVNSPAVTLSTSPAVVTTTNGRATFQLVFSTPLVVGDYLVHVVGEDCTGSSCVSLSVGANFSFSVVPGVPVGLVSVPDSSNSAQVPADLSVPLGGVVVYVVDAAGNRLNLFDEDAHSISVTSVDASNVARGTGSQLGGTTTVTSSQGVAWFTDLVLTNPGPTGAREPSETSVVNDLTYAAPSRGVSGADDVYRLLFSATFGGSSVETLAVFTAVIGRARYLEIDNHAVATMVTSSTTSTIASSIALKLYDAGNNVITLQDAGMQVEVGPYPASNSPTERTLTPTSTVIETDTAGTATWTFAANSITLHNEPAGYYRIGFFVVGSAYIQPAIQLIQLTPGTIGHQWRYVLADGEDIRFADASTPLGDLKIYVGDVSGSALGDADRFDSATSAYKVWRTFSCSSATLTLVGTLTGDTQGAGEATLSGITLTSPTLGAHTISCVSTGNTWKDEQLNVIGTSATALQALDINIEVTAGAPVGFAITSSPRLAYTPSLGVVTMSSFRDYAADLYVPLDEFTMKLYDTYSNEVTYALSSGATRVVQLSYASGVASDTLNKVSDYLTFNSTVSTRDAFIVVDPYVGTGNLAPALSAENRATLSGLALKRATVGSHTFTFSVPADPALAAVTSTITVTLGRAHHLAVRAPCDDYYTQGVSCTAFSTLSRSGAGCTCTQYTSAALVTLTPIHVVIMDGGDNVVGASFEAICQPGDASCTPVIEAVFDVARTNPCVLSGSSCAATQPTRHTKTITSGAAEFSDIAFQLPKASTSQNSAILTFKSFGLVDVALTYEIFPGSATALDVVVPSSFSGTEDGAGLHSAENTLVGKSTAPFIVNVIDAAGNSLGAYDTSTRTVTIAVVDDTATITGALSISTSSGTVSANNFYLASPVRGNHVLRFASAGLTSFDVTVKIIEGRPHAVKHITTVETITSYASAESVQLGKFTVHMTDAGGELMLANSFSKQVTATLRSKFNSTRTSTVKTYATSVVTSPIGRAVLIFDEIIVHGLEIGSYALTFSADGLTSASVDVTFTVGLANQLNVPSQHGYPTVNDAQYYRPTTLAAARTISIAPFVVAVTDGGVNELLSADTVVGRNIGVSIVYAQATNRRVFSADPTISDFTISNGVALISAIKLYNPIAGIYNVTVSSTVPVALKTFEFQITITSGDVSSLDACGCVDCVRADISVAYPQGLCSNVNAYKSADVVQLQDVLVATRDAGGLLMGSTLNADERRAVSVQLVSYTLVTGESYTPTTATSPMLADASNEVSCLDATVGCEEVISPPSPPPTASPPPPANGQPPAPPATPPPPPAETQYTRAASVGALYVINGIVAWCADGTSLHPSKNFCTPASASAEADKTTHEIAYLTELAANGDVLPDVAGTPGTALDFYGVRTAPGFVGDAKSLRFNRPKAGSYVLQFTSTCLEEKCPYSQNLGLISEFLEITIEPGVPHRLEFGGTPLPRRFDTNVTLPVFDVTTYDIADNVLEAMDANVTLTVAPPPFAVVGGSVPIVRGKAVFDGVKIIGMRGVEYDLTFSIADASITHEKMRIIPCEDVKPHASPMPDGSCACIAGYTEDHDVSGASALISTASFPDLYSQITTSVPLQFASYIQSLRPYGVCVPCAAGFYKSGVGSMPCDRCPANMDTYTGDDGMPVVPHVSQSGQTLPGYLGNTQKSACQCVVAEAPANKTESVRAYYRLDPPESYTCGACPAGAVCDARDVTYLSLLSGHWRANASTLSVFTCKSPHACAGGVGAADALCNAGYAGPLCGSCDRHAGYASLEDSKALETSLKCNKCWAPVASAFVMLMLLAAQLVVWQRVCAAAQSYVATSVVYTKVFVSHFQMLATLGLIDLGWPNAVGIIFPISRVTTSVSLKSFPADCLLKWSHASYAMYSMFSVCVFAALCVPYYCYMRITAFFKLRDEWYATKRELEDKYIAARRNGDDTRSLKHKLERMRNPPEFGDTVTNAYDLVLKTKVNSDGYIVQEYSHEELTNMAPTAWDLTLGLFYATTLYMCWMPTLTGALRMIRTTEIEDIGTYLYVDYSVQTNTASFKVYLTIILIGASMFTAYMPYLAFKALRERSETLTWMKTMTRYGFLYLGFNPERYYWELVVFMRKGMLVSIAVLLPDTPLLAAYLSVGVIQLSLALVLLLDVYERERHRRLETISLVVTLISYNSGALMSSVRHAVSEIIASFALYFLNVAFVLYFMSYIRGDLEDEVIAAKLASERKDVESEEHLRREAVKRALVDTHQASRALHPRMASDLIAAFDNQTLVEELSKPGASDLKLKHVQLSVHLESIRNKWRQSKSLSNDPVARRDYETAVLALERKKAAMDHERWRRRVQACADSGGDSDGADVRSVASESRSSEGDPSKSVESDDSAFDRVDARVMQYNEIIAQQRLLAEREARREWPTDALGRELARVEPTYPPEYVPRPPRLPAQDSVSWTPPSAEIMLSSPLQSPTKAPRPMQSASVKPPKPPKPGDPFTYDYFELTAVRDALPTVEKQMQDLESSITANVAATRAHASTSTSLVPPPGERQSWRERMNDSSWRVQRRINAREKAALMREFGQDDDDGQDDKEPTRRITVRENGNDGGDGHESVDDQLSSSDDDHAAPRRAPAGRAGRRAASRRL